MFWLYKFNSRVIFFQSFKDYQMPPLFSREENILASKENLVHARRFACFLGALKIFFASRGKLVNTWTRFLLFLKTENLVFLLKKFLEKLEWGSSLRALSITWDFKIFPILEIFWLLFIEYCSGVEVFCLRFLFSDMGVQKLKTEFRITLVQIRIFTGN